MIDEWRHFLYPLGFLSSIFFGGRFLYQWLHSEIQKQSTVNKLFWVLSLVGNVLLYSHSVIQLQVHVALTQAINAIISWRNLNLMSPREQKASFRFVVFLLIASVVLTIGLFSLQAQAWPSEASNWLRTPSVAYMTFAGTAASPFWHLLGTVGIVLFSCRFWLQWWTSERRASSQLSPAFFWVSLLGSLLTLVYFARIQDPANLIGPIFGLVPYIRNLMLIRKARA